MLYKFYTSEGLDPAIQHCENHIHSFTSDYQAFLHAIQYVAGTSKRFNAVVDSYNLHKDNSVETSKLSKILYDLNDTTRAVYRIDRCYGEQRKTLFTYDKILRCW